MTVIENTTKSLQMNPDDLLRESLKVFIDQKLSAIEAEIFSIAKKGYGVRYFIHLPLCPLCPLPTFTDMVYA